MTPLFAVAGVGLVLLGLRAFVLRRNLIRRILAFNVMGSGIFLVLVSNGARSDPPDPVPHALVLTGIVVAVSATGFGLALVRRLHAETGLLVLPEEADGDDTT